MQRHGPLTEFLSNGKRMAFKKVNTGSVRNQFDAALSPSIKKSIISTKLTCILRIQLAVNSPHPAVSILLAVAAISIHHCLQPAPETATGGPHGVPGAT